MTNLKLSVLGTPHLERDGQAAHIERHKALALLVYLAVTGQPHRRDALAALLWPDHDQAHARAALRRTLFSLNTALATDALDADRETIGLLAAEGGSGWWVDVAQFRRLLAACLAHGHPVSDVCPDCLRPLAEAAALYRGDFLAGLTLHDSPDFDDWQLFEAETLRRELGGALERLVRGASAHQEFEAAAGYARRWLALDPLHEPAHCALMSSYAWAGQRSAALRQYGECARLMERELGAPPQAATTQLYEAIRMNALLPLPGLSQAPAGRGRPSCDEPSLRLSSSSRRQSADAHPPQSFSLLDRIVRGRLVGRDREVALIRGLWDRAAAGEGHVLLVSGEAGIGKTRLARKRLRSPRDRRPSVLIGRCEAESAAPYAPMAQLVRSPG